MTTAALVVILLQQAWIIQQNRRLIRQGMKIMSQLDTLKAAISDLDDATNKVADRITALSAAIKPGMTDDEVADVKTQLDAVSARLTTLGADPTDVVPAEPTA